jgi:outer membrane protein assembly factor BamB
LEDLDDVQSSPKIGSDGTIYVAGGSHVYAVDPRGVIRWAYETTDGGFASSSPAVAGNGTIYVGGMAGRLHAINADGSPRWKFDTGEDNSIRSSPAIGRDGTIYFTGYRDQRLYAVAPDGSGGGSVPLEGNRVSSTPSIGRDGSIHVGVGWEGLYAIDSGGSVRRLLKPGTTSTPILGADGSIYLTGTGPSGQDAISAFDSQGRLQWDYPTPPLLTGEALPRRSGASPAIGVDGTILAISANPLTLYAIVEKGSTNGGYAGSPWPTARGNRANNGRAGG